MTICYKKGLNHNGGNEQSKLRNTAKRSKYARGHARKRSKHSDQNNNKDNNSKNCNDRLHLLSSD